MTNIDTVIDIASTAFLDNLSNNSKNLMQKGIMWSDYDQDDYLIEVCEAQNLPINLFFDSNNGNHDKFLRAIIAKMNERGISYKLGLCYEYLVA